jgi:hypothetical protein
MTSVPQSHQERTCGWLHLLNFLYLCTPCGSLTRLAIPGLAALLLAGAAGISGAYCDAVGGELAAGPRELPSPRSCCVSAALALRSFWTLPFVAFSCRCIFEVLLVDFFLACFDGYFFLCLPVERVLPSSPGWLPSMQNLLQFLLPSSPFRCLRPWCWIKCRLLFSV